MKRVAYTVQATAEQAQRWRRAATSEGFLNVGMWLGAAADRWLTSLKRPLPLAWRKGAVRVVLASGQTAEYPGYASPPFGVYRGTDAGRRSCGCHRYTLVYLPQARVLATLGSLRDARALAASLADQLVKWDDPRSAFSVEPGAVLARFGIPLP